MSDEVNQVGGLWAKQARYWVEQIKRNASTGAQPECLPEVIRGLFNDISYAAGNALEAMDLAQKQPRTTKRVGSARGKTEDYLRKTRGILLKGPIPGFSGPLDELPGGRVVPLEELKPFIKAFGEDGRELSPVEFARRLDKAGVKLSSPPYLARFIAQITQEDETGAYSLGHGGVALPAEAEPIPPLKRPEPEHHYAGHAGDLPDGEAGSGDVGYAGDALVMPEGPASSFHPIFGPFKPIPWGRACSSREAVPLPGAGGGSSGPILAQAILPQALAEMEGVLLEGARTHPPNDWRELGGLGNMDHAQQHLEEFEQYQQTDDLAHAFVRLGMALQLRLEREAGSESEQQD